MAILKLVGSGLSGSVGSGLFPTRNILKIRLNSEISNQELIDRNQTAMESGYGFSSYLNNKLFSSYVKFTTSRIIERKGRENEISRVCVRTGGFPWGARWRDLKDDQCMADAGSKIHTISCRIICLH